MAYVVCEPCRDCKYTDCVLVCPMDCFYQDDRQLYIDPSQCIDCDACKSQCPVDAIFQDHTVPTQWQDFIALNAARSHELKQTSGPLTEKQEPLCKPT